MKKKKTKIVVWAVAMCLIVAVGLFASNAPSGQNSSSGPQVTVYKSPTCGCCVNYIAYLRREGYDVEVVEERNMSSIKQAHNIPRSMESCHTTVMGDYFIEGHVPLEAIDVLFEQKPQIDGIALPAMPSGSPGMPGFKTGPFEIYGLTDGQTELFTTI